MADAAAYPVLFGTTQASWAPIDLRFELLTGEADPTRIARVYVVPFVGAACDCLYGYGEVELVGPPQLQDGPERTVAVEVLAPGAAVSLLAGKGRPWEAELYRLAASHRAADHTPS
jgi:hypothetical protein